MTLVRFAVFESSVFHPTASPCDDKKPFSDGVTCGVTWYGFRWSRHTMCLHFILGEESDGEPSAPLFS